MPPTVLREDSNGLATLTLNRPAKLNALNSDIFLALNEHISDLEKCTDTVGVVLIRGAGKCFSAGLDLGEVAKGEQKISALFQSKTIDRLASLPQPVIAAVHGHCYTGALELALAADILFAAGSAQFGDTHAKWGLTPAWGMSQRLPRRIGRAQSFCMMLTAKTINVRDALAMGLVDVTAPDSTFDDDLQRFIGSILTNSWFSHRANKKLLNDTDGLPLSAGLAQEFFRRAGRAPDFEERIARFSKC